MDEVQVGYMHPNNEAMLPHFSKFPSVQRQYDLLREEVADMRDQWHAGEMQTHTFEIYTSKLCMLMIMKMWSWNYYSEENWIQDPEIQNWFMEVPDA
jgi:hypothetical protein